MVVVNGDQHNLDHDDQPLLIDDQQPLDDQETACIKFVDISSTGHATVSSWRSHGRNYFYQNLPSPPVHFLRRLCQKNSSLCTPSYSIISFIFLLGIIYKSWMKLKHKTNVVFYQSGCAQGSAVPCLSALSSPIWTSERATTCNGSAG